MLWETPTFRESPPNDPLWRRAYQAQWYAENAERVKAAASARYYAKPEERREEKRDYWARNGEAINAARRAVYIKLPRAPLAPKLDADAARSRSRSRYLDPGIKKESAQARHADPAEYLLRNSVRRSKQKTIEHAIVKGDIHLTECCPICGVRMVVSDGAWAGNSFTLDRVDPAKGYLPGNIAVICFNCNAVKSNGSAELHERIAVYMRKGGCS